MKGGEDKYEEFKQILGKGFLDLFAQIEKENIGLFTYAKYGSEAKPKLAQDDDVSHQFIQQLMAIARKFRDIEGYVPDTSVDKSSKQIPKLENAIKNDKFTPLDNGSFPYHPSDKTKYISKVYHLLPLKHYTNLATTPNTLDQLLHYVYIFSNLFTSDSDPEEILELLMYDPAYSRLNTKFTGIFSKATESEDIELNDIMQNFIYIVLRDKKDEDADDPYATKTDISYDPTLLPKIGELDTAGHITTYLNKITADPVATALAAADTVTATPAVNILKGRIDIFLNNIWALINGFKTNAPLPGSKAVTPDMAGALVSVYIIPIITHYGAYNDTNKKYLTNILNNTRHLTPTMYGNTIEPDYTEGGGVYARRQVTNWW